MHSDLSVAVLVEQHESVLELIDLLFCKGFDECSSIFQSGHTVVVVAVRYFFHFCFFCLRFWLLFFSIAHQHDM